VHAVRKLPDAGEVLDRHAPYAAAVGTRRAISSSVSG
jgi:hypothetical protein